MNNEILLPKEIRIAETLYIGRHVKLFTIALNRVNFLDNFHGTMKYTVFAPEDVAFENFLKENNYKDIYDVSKEVFKVLVTNKMI
ncbi:hypothetical protein FUMI01_17700 [Flavobacterium sp. UMI-01]|nr:hypothetical protein FUMI01_17700 [Flavobacterium sp. UMI-01]